MPPGRLRNPPTTPRHPLARPSCASTRLNRRNRAPHRPWLPTKRRTLHPIGRRPPPPQRHLGNRTEHRPDRKTRRPPIRIQKATPARDRIHRAGATSPRQTGRRNPTPRPQSSSQPSRWRRRQRPRPDPPRRKTADSARPRRGARATPLQPNCSARPHRSRLPRSGRRARPRESAPRPLHIPSARWPGSAPRWAGRSSAALRPTAGRCWR